MIFNTKNITGHGPQQLSYRKLFKVKRLDSTALWLCNIAL